MQVVTPDFIRNKKVLLRLDIDVPLGKVTGGRLQVTDDFRLRAGMPTLKMCLEHAAEVVIMGHIGRPHFAEASRGEPGGLFDPSLSVAPIYNWLEDQGFSKELQEGKLKLLENLRFEPGEEACDLEYAKELASLGEVYVNGAFAAHHPAASTTILPTLMPHAAGLRFVREVGVLRGVRENPRKPLVVIIGGAKVEDKLPTVLAMAKIADYVLVGGKIAEELSALGGQLSESSQSVVRWPETEGLKTDQLTSEDRKLKTDNKLPMNVLLAELNKEGTDVTPETIDRWQEIIQEAKTVVWNGPVGKLEGNGISIMYYGKEEDFGSERGTYELAHILADCEAEVIVGGGDTVGFLGRLGMLDKFVHPEHGRRAFVSTGGGAMLKFLEKGTLPTIEALDEHN